MVLHLFLYIYTSFSSITMTLYTQSHIFSIQLNLSCLYTVTSHHTVTSSPHRHIPFHINVSYIHVSLLYSYISYISLPTYLFTLFLHFLHLPHFSLFSDFSYTLRYISHTPCSSPFQLSMHMHLDFSACTSCSLLHTSLSTHNFSLHCSLFYLDTHLLPWGKLWKLGVIFSASKIISSVNNKTES